jgi:DNA repair exonuclease SbcCD ATPase subunit
LSLRLDNAPTPTEVDLSSLEQAIVDIYGQLEVLTGRFENLPTPQEAELGGVAQAITDINVQLDTLTGRLDNLPTPQAVEVAETDQAIADINVQLDTLTGRLDNLPTPPAVELTETEREIADINTQLHALNQQFNAQPETQAIKQVERAIAQITEQMNSIVSRVGDLLASSEVDRSSLEQAITDIYGQLDSLNQQFNARPETEAIEQLEGALAQIAEQLQALALPPEHSPTSQKDDQSGEEAIADINFQLQAVALCLENLPPLPALNISGVEEAIAQVNVHLDALNQAQPETQAIEPLEAAIAQLKKQLNALALCLEDQPTSLEIDFGDTEPSIADLQW